MALNLVCLDVSVKKEGISYGVGSGFNAPALDKTASISLFAMFAPQNLDRLKVAVKEEVEGFVRMASPQLNLLMQNKP